MHIQLEAHDKHTIRSYTEQQVTIDGIEYRQSIVVSKDTLHSNWAVHALNELNKTTLEPLLMSEPEIIIIGHQHLNVPTPMSILQYLSQRKIGIECMSIGAACRTFNVLLGEHRKVVIGIILTSQNT